jgi:hypothetical protein
MHWSGLLAILAATGGMPNAVGDQSARIAPGAAPKATLGAARASLAESASRSTLYACDFSESVDANYDGWPDGWTRRRGAGYPPYLKVGITPIDPEAPRGPRQLQMNLDGGAIQVNSPLLSVSGEYEYLLEVDLRTVDLKNHVAFVTLVFYDESHLPIATLTSQRFSQQDSWIPIRLGPHTPPRKTPSFVGIGLHLTPGLRRDLSGSAMFANLRLTQVPRLKLQANRRTPVFDAGESIEVSCAATGLGETPQMILTLVDADDNVLEQRELHGAVDRWQLPTLPVGYYRMRASLVAPSGLSLMHELPIAVTDARPDRQQGEFGWSLSRGQPLTVRELADLVERSGIHWLKYPIWKEATDAQTVSEMSWLAERLNAERIQLIGVLDEPPVEVKTKSREPGRPSVGAVLADDDAWPGALDSILTRLALHIRYWQFGDDQDQSVQGVPNLVDRLVEVRKYFHQYGSNLRIGFAWPWVRELPEAKASSWDFVTRTDDPSLTERELRSYLSNAASQRNANLSRAARWVAIQPLARDVYSFRERARDLILRMLAAKIEGAGAVLASDPCDVQTGLLNSDGSPTDLYLPWSNTAQHVAGTRYLGAIRLPRGSPNYLFARGEEITMVVWNDSKVEEQLYLGENVRVFDVWGRSQPLPTTQNDGWSIQQLIAQPLPVFVVGLDPFVTQFRLATSFETPRLDTAIGREQLLRFNLGNTTPSRIDGNCEFRGPETWRITDKRQHFELSPGQSESLGVHVQLGKDLSVGVQQVQLDFEITADRTYRFSSYGTVELGSGDFTLDLAARLDDDGDLIVDQMMQNHGSGLVNFNCVLFIPERGREWKPIRNLGPGQATVTFVIPDGKELIGKVLWLRAEEVGGERMLSKDLLVSP